MRREEHRSGFEILALPDCMRISIKYDRACMESRWHEKSIKRDASLSFQGPFSTTANLQLSDLNCIIGTTRINTMQFSSIFITAAVFVGAISAAAVPDTNIPGIDLNKRSCNEEQFRQCTRNCPTGTGGGPIGCPIGCCIAAGCF
ncbi:hypothetical protein FOQG_14029 [Fusarium oxysporum f. sp. raphani 54005]|uniref:Uncharacterized protein n=2 Tax=Fusarium oxysporum f. sp. raphani TaxID=96318 RepID=X0BHH2_FUSOX|nr:hypothetical protein FOQG_14029 [Fusarium oxysporum f. sp. raphani 54005]